MNGKAGQDVPDACDEWWFVGRDGVMTLAGWREVIRKSRSDDVLAANLADLLYEQDEAKQSLRDMGFGVTGSPWRDVIDEIRAKIRRKAVR